MAKATTKVEITSALRKGYEAWMRGETFNNVKARLKRSLMPAFIQLAKVHTWKQARAKRQANVLALRAEEKNRKTTKRPTAAAKKNGATAARRKIRRVTAKTATAPAAVAATA